MYELSKDHEDFRKVVREFATEAIEPHVAKWDREHHFPADLVPTISSDERKPFISPSGHAQE